jgi:diaminohydroxyphosphoribosylaminopyrimidine deaminase/5-amino-6-(5-phosphoribosylamino)uracil reductase
LPLDAAGRPDIGAALEYLGSHGVNHLLVEAGTGLATAFLAADAVDRIYWTQSDHILGNDALPAVGPLARQGINEVALCLERTYIQSHQRMIGADRLVVLEKSSV